MIPKTIHYCWFGRNPKPKLAKKCIRSWKKYCPDYKIIEWNEDNYDISAAPLYVRQAYDAKKWAFVTDYVRLDVIYRSGGIYLDTDVEVLRSLDPFLSDKVYFGLENAQYVNTGLGFGAEKGSPILAEMMADYQDIPFILPDGSYNPVTCLMMNKHTLVNHGFVTENKEQLLDGGIHIYPSDFFCPRGGFGGERRLTKNTYTDHHFDASWVEKKQKKEWTKSVKKRDRKDKRDKLGRFLLGQQRYNALKRQIKKLKNKF